MSSPSCARTAPLALAAFLALGGCWATDLDAGTAQCPGPRDERACVRTGAFQAQVVPRASTGRPIGGSGASGAGGGSVQPGTASGRGGSGGQLPVAGADNPTPNAPSGAGTGAPGGGDAGAPEPIAPSPPPSAVLVGEVQNARDLGGVALADGAVVAEGTLFRGPPLAPLSESGCRALEKLGVRTIIDLRIESERLSKPDADCAQQQARVVLAPLPIPYSVSTQDYINDLYTLDSIALAFEALGDPDAYPIYFHCTWGRDRTGVLAALILRALGAERDAILNEYLLSLDSVGAYPDSLEGMLDELEFAGGVDAYLKSAGIPRAAVDALRAQLTRQPQ